MMDCPCVLFANPAAKTDCGSQMETSIYKQDKFDKRSLMQQERTATAAIVFSRIALGLMGGLQTKSATIAAVFRPGGTS